MGKKYEPDITSSSYNTYKKPNLIIGRNYKRPLIFRLFYDNALNHFFASANNLYNVKARVKSCIDTC